MSKLLTDWLTICTAGKTVDGRTIKEEWLTESAEHYDREEYAAFVNCDHWYGNLGVVNELRVAKDSKDRTILQAKIAPNKYFLQQNSEGLRLCYSAEFITNFAERGHAYLVGLATTDSPASVGTTETHFVAKNEVVRSDALEGEITLTENSFLKKIFGNKKKETKEMTNEEFNAGLAPVIEKINGLVEMLSKDDSRADSMTQLSQQVTELTAQVETLSKAVADGQTEVPTKGAEPGDVPADEDTLI